MNRKNIIKMCILCKTIYRFNAIPIKIPMVFFHRTVTKIYMEPPKTLNSHYNLKKNKVGGITVPDIKLYYKTIVIKTARYWHKNSHGSSTMPSTMPFLVSSLYSPPAFSQKPTQALRFC